MLLRHLRRIVAALLVHALALPAAAQVAHDGPPAPEPPEVFTADSAGRITLRATRIGAPLAIDGVLDEPVYREVRPITHFVQQEPHEGQAATERTEAWLFFDDRHFYVAVRAYDSEPSRLVANELRRDSFNIFQNDNITISIDPLYTRRSGYFFQTNALGAQRDQEVQDERSNNNDWNAIWDTRARILPDGWSMEFALPFTSLRLRTAGPQVWGFNLRRVVRWKNEHASIAPIPASAGVRAMYRFDIFATLVGVEVPAVRRTLDLKPYAIAASTTNLGGTPPVRNDPSANAGLDLKYALTPSLVADVTYRTDFAQVEEDQQQVNLTRFSLFFPEKREFFLEGQGLFGFGAEQRGGFGGGQGAVRSQAPVLAPIVFFSRRIGLEGGRQVPIVAGGRLAGRAGRFGLGLLTIQTEASPATQTPATRFSVMRLRRDVLRRSDVGIVATHRAPEGGAANAVVGADANFWFFQNVALSGFVAQSWTEGERHAPADRRSYRGEFEYGGDRYGLKYEHLFVGARFDPQVGFLRRPAMRRHFVQGRFSPRPASRRVRKHTFEVDLDHIAGAGGRLETREVRGTYRLELHNNDQWVADYTETYELLRAPFAVVRGATIPPGAYRFGSVRTTYQFGPQRRVSGSLTLRRGGFFGGTNSEIGYRGVVEIAPRFNVEPGASLNVLDLPAGRFQARLLTVRSTLMVSPHMALTGLVQYNSTAASLGSSVRFRWEYRPGSDLFLVYSDGRDTGQRRGFPDLQNRTLIVKLTRLFRT